MVIREGKFKPAYFTGVTNHPGSNSTTSRDKFIADLTTERRLF